MAKNVESFSEIQRLRALAVLLVIWGHLPYLSGSMYKYTGSWAGVDLFFVISGFIVTKSWFNYSQKFSASWKQLIGSFYIRRIFRIVPLAAWWIFITYLATRFFNATGAWGELKDLNQEIVSIATLTYNYKVLSTMTSHLGVYWSLIVEEHFYLILPWFLLFKASMKNKMIALLALVLFTMLISRNFLIPASHNWENLFLLTHLRIDSLLMGVLIYFCESEYGFTKKIKLPLWVGMPLAALGVGFLWLMPWLAPIEWARTTGLTFNTLAGSLLVMLAICNRGYVFEIPYLRKILEWIGSRSYGLYLGHIWLMPFEKEVLFSMVNSKIRYFYEYPSWRVPFTLFLLFAVAEVNYWIIEKPLRECGVWLSSEFLKRR